MSNKMLRATADVVYGSRGSVDPELLTSYFEERGKTNGISMFLNKRLSEYLKPFRLVIDVNRQPTSKRLDCTQFFVYKRQYR
jgi:hypothetical protein